MEGNMHGVGARVSAVHAEFCRFTLKCVLRNLFSCRRNFSLSWQFL